MFNTRFHTISNLSISQSVCQESYVVVNNDDIFQIDSYL